MKRKIIKFSIVLSIIAFAAFTPIFGNFNMLKNESMESQVDDKSTDNGARYEEEQVFSNEESDNAQQNIVDTLSLASWEATEGEYRVDIDYEFSIDLGNVLIELAGMFIGLWFEGAEMEVELNPGEHQDTYSRDTTGLWERSSTFELKGSGLTTVSFDCSTHWAYYPWIIPIGDPVDFDSYYYVDIEIDPKTENVKSDSDDDDLLCEISTYPIAEVTSIEINETDVKFNEDFEVSYTVHNPTTWGAWSGSVDLERKVGNNNWEVVDSQTTTINSDQSKNFTVIQNIYDSTEDMKVLYRVKLYNTEFQYLSTKAFITLNPSHPFISQFTVVLNREYFDLGRFNPTDEFKVIIEVANPMYQSEPFAPPANYDGYLILNRTFVSSEGIFEISKSSHIFIEEKDSVNSPSKTISVEFKADNSDGYNQSEEFYLTPGLLSSINYIDNVSGREINLDDWNWFSYSETNANWEILSTEAQIEFEAYLIEDIDDTKRVQERLVYVPVFKNTNLNEMIYLMESYKRVNALIEKQIESLKVDLIAAVVIPFPIDLIFWDSAFDTIDAIELTSRISSELFDQIVTNYLMVLDPPDMDYYQISPIIYEPLDVNISEESLKNQNIAELYQLADSVNKLEDISKAMLTTQERYVGSIMFDENNATQIQADTLKQYTQIKVNYLNDFLSKSEGVFDYFTPRNIILSHEEWDYEEIVLEYQIAQANVIENDGLLPEQREELIGKGYSDDEINEMIEYFLINTLDGISDELDNLYDDFNNQINKFNTEREELVNDMLNGVNEIVTISKNPDQKTEFTLSTNEGYRKVDIEIDPFLQEVANGDTIIYNLEIENINVETLTYTLEIINTEELGQNNVNFPAEITLGPGEKSLVNIEVIIPIDIPPMFLNPEVKVITTLNGRSYTETESFIIVVIDDDISPPELFLTHKGEKTDGQSGTLEFKFGDPESEATAELLITGPMDYYYHNSYLTEGVFSLDLNEIGIKELGIYEVKVSAENNDEDGWVGDEEINTFLINFEITDDDVEVPKFCNLLITDDIHLINVSLNITDQSGIGQLKVFVEGVEITPSSVIKSGNNYLFTLKNQWILQKGIYDIEILATDADNDRLNDNMTSSIFGVFEISLDEMYEYVDWKLNEIKKYIEENLSNQIVCCLNWKLTKAQKYLEKAYCFLEKGKISCGIIYDKIAKQLISNAKSKIGILNKHCRISDENAVYIQNSLSEIRNNIVILMGASTCSELAYEIAYIEIDLLNLKDDIEEKIQTCKGSYLTCMMESCVRLLEISFFKIPKGESINCLIKCIIWKLQHITWKVNSYFEKGYLSEEIHNFLISEISRIIEKVSILTISA